MGDLDGRVTGEGIQQYPVGLTQDPASIMACTISSEGASLLTQQFVVGNDDTNGRG